MVLYSLETGTMDFDGGAMFGVVPKVLWNNSYPANGENKITITMRSLYIEMDDYKILIDTGSGHKLSEKQHKIYGYNTTNTLLDSLAEMGVTREEITHVILTHLHFDHCGGCTMYNQKGKLELTFPNATHYISESQWEETMNPNPRERASFFDENYKLIDKKKKLQFVRYDQEVLPGIYLKHFHGHTRGQLIPHLDYKGNTVVGVTDLIPSVTNLPLAWVAAYDVSPLITMEEKESFLTEAVQKNYVLYFMHDAHNECCTLKETEKGIRADKTFTLEAFVEEVEED